MAAPVRPRRLTEAPRVRGALIAAAWAWLGLLVLLPLAAVFAYALREGAGAAWRALADPDTRSAARLTLVAVAVAVPVNALCGLAAAWAVAKHRFPGRGALSTLIDLPFSVSPVIAGLVFVLLFGAHGACGPWLAAHGLRVIFALPGIVLASVFVTFPFVARELIPLMQEQGTEEEEAAVSLGAGGWQVFRRVTLPNIRGGLLLGAVQCAARAMGEFGAVSVVSGHVRGLTVTLPLHAEILYNEYRTAAAFTIAALLACVGLASLAARKLLEARAAGEA